MEDKKHVAIIGGGIAGMESAGILVKFGYKVTVIEKTDKTGGKLRNWSYLFPDFADPNILVDDINNKATLANVNIIYNTEISHIKKQNGRFELSDIKDVKIFSDAVVIASGFKLFDASLKEEYGYGIFDNVITSVDLERIIKAKKVLSTIDNKIPQRVAIIHCVGSRDAKVGNTYCSKVCCITAIKQAIEINKMIPECEVFCFYMDLRLYGSHFDSLYLSAQQQHNIQFIRGRLSEVSEKQDNSLQIKAEDTLSGRPLRMKVDMVVLMVGMEPELSNNNLITDNTVQLDENGFFKSKNIHDHRSCTTHNGIFAAGACLCPMSVSETLENARSVVFEVNDYFEKQKT
ncbi:MAG: CoB--CoM heterodisulfide reductase iron-sulfur subunit A family protein [Bacteroidales bacterium]|nr:CoB--CoM heterodisulfide reductase iron-sulfur subunit A family protein [Bacteroidales bacterium]